MSLQYLPWNQPASHADRPCLRDDRQELSYAEVARHVEGFATRLAEEGVGRGDVVAIMLPNRIELLVALMAAWRLGAAATLVNPTFTATEAEYQIADSGAVLVIGADRWEPAAGRRFLHVDEMRRTAGPRALPAPDVRPDDLALLIYTSGSTGRPKGVMLAHANLAAMAEMMAGRCRVTGDDHCLLVLPLFHVNAVCVSFLMPMLHGAQLTVLERFAPESFLAAVERLRPTYFSAVPTIYARLVELPEDVRPDLSSLRFAISGAAPISRELLQRASERFGLVIVEGYGLTEGTCASTCNPLDGPRKPGSVGPALPGQQVAVIGPDGAFLPVGQRGEVVIKGPNVMRGYLGRPEETARTVVDGWLRTGDIGVLDEDGYLTLVDRAKDMIIRGGENIYPKEIEAVLQSHPDVLEAAVVGAPHALYGEVPVAYVVRYPGAVATAEDLLGHCRGHLAKVKLPSVELVDALPRNPVGKIDKPFLRRQLQPNP